MLLISQSYDVCFRSDCIRSFLLAWCAVHAFMLRMHLTGMRGGHSSFGCIGFLSVDQVNAMSVSTRHFAVIMMIIR